jgi:hydroxymethylbilane synthase
MWQARHVAERLGRPYELVVVNTAGDRRPDVPISRIGGQGAFVKEVQQAVLDGRADLAVHSAKDLHSEAHPALALAAVPERADPRDALVGAQLDELAPGSRVATGAVRRRAQLAWRRPDLCFAELRGNIGTRLAKASSFEAAVLAAAALDRLGRSDAIAQRLPPWIMVPQAGQGALAVECSRRDGQVLEALRPLDHPPSRAAVECERAFLAELGGGCQLPAGALATWEGGRLSLLAVVCSPDGSVRLSQRGTGAEPAVLGREVARRLMDGCGGASIGPVALP